MEDALNQEMFSLCIQRSHAHVLRRSLLEMPELRHRQTAAATRFTYIHVQNVGKIRDKHPPNNGVGNELIYLIPVGRESRDSTVMTCDR